MIGWRSTDGLGPKKRALWSLVRPLFPRRWRWFYEGHPRIPGQLWFAERKLLYETVRAHSPLNCFEIGTWKGGGSTLFIAQGLHDNSAGKLHTVEMDGTFYREAVENYHVHLPHLEPFVDFNLGDYQEVLATVAGAAGGVDLLFLDGPEHAEKTLEQYRFFLPWMRQGTVLVAHDWYTEKSGLLKPLIERGGQWEILRLLSPPQSVGLALAIMR